MATVTLTLEGLLPPSPPTEELAVTWTRDGRGRVALRAQRGGGCGGYSWYVERLRGKDTVALPGGLGISGIAAALAALDRGEVPEWTEVRPSASRYVSAAGVDYRPQRDADGRVGVLVAWRAEAPGHLQPAWVATPAGWHRGTPYAEGGDPDAAVAALLRELGWTRDQITVTIDRDGAP